MAKRHTSGIKRSAAKVAAKIAARPRKNRTLSLDDKRFRELQRYCALNDLKASQVIDELIASFLEQVD